MLRRRDCELAHDHLLDTRKHLLKCIDHLKDINELVPGAVKLMGSACHYIDALDVDLSIVTLHAAGSVAHSKLSKQALNRAKALLMGAELERLGQGLQVLSLDEAHQRLKLLNRENLIVDVAHCRRLQLNVVLFAISHFLVKCTESEVDSFVLLGEEVAEKR